MSSSARVTSPPPLWEQDIRISEVLALRVGRVADLLSDLLGDLLCPGAAHAGLLEGAAALHQGCPALDVGHAIARVERARRRRRGA
eukprot:15482715-Alexandrium_andersonii.AAC.1